MRNMSFEDNEFIICGNDRVIKDFLYIFDHVRYKSIVSDIEGVETDRPVIICGFDKQETEDKLRERGLERGTDYFYEEDFFDLLDDFCIPADKKTVIWGTGAMAEHFCKEEPECFKMVSFFIDSFPGKENYKGRPVVNPDDIDSWNSLFIIIAVYNDGEIRDRLNEAGLKEGVNYIGFRQYLERPSKMIRRTVFDKAYYDLDCRTMLNHLEVLQKGETSCCCTTFISERLGSVLESSTDKIWKSVRHKILCLSAENHTYSFCDKTMCPLFVSNIRKRNISDVDISGIQYRAMDDKPGVLALAYDDICNLHCSSCRDKVYVPTEKDKNDVKTITDIIIDKLLPDCRFLIMAGAGEVLLNDSYKRVYRDENCRPEYIRLLSNGLLFDKKHWDELIRGKSSKIMITVSVDAATKETYERIRCGGNFDVLKRNMEFAAGLRRSGELSYFRMNFVVQKDNYREMPLFVEWAESLGCDEVFFTKVLNWGTYTEEEFRKVSMMEDDGVTPKKDLTAVMSDPAMHSSIVDMGTIQALHKADEASHVENYYMWELEKRGGRLFGK